MHDYVSVRSLRALLVAIAFAVTMAVGATVRVTADPVCTDGFSGSGCCKKIGDDCESTEDCGGFRSPCTCLVFSTFKCAQR